MSKSFGPMSTADEVLEGIDLSGRRILVTGVSAGLGVETARALVARGAEVVGAVRDQDKARRATEHVRATATRGGSLTLKKLDLASLASVRACSNQLLAAGKSFDVVIANAGVMACPQSKTSDGFETHFGTNHLGHFVLVNRIISLFKSGSRLIILSSGGHRFSDVDLADPNFEHTPYAPFVAYGRSKTANILFAVEFDRLYKSQSIRAAAVHPGSIETQLGRHLTQEAKQAAMKEVEAARSTSTQAFTWKSIQQGAATSVWAACVATAEEIGGRYCEDCSVAEIVSGVGTTPKGVRPYAVDLERAKALWAKSVEMVSERFS
jgi:NAD(P)-dependent dehydrogenase (short-subunit alcohol dehydrogenase family)